MFSAVLKAVGRLPLRVIHGLGAALGMLVYWASPTYRRRLRENLLGSGIPRAQALIGAVARETGKGTLELAALWFAPRERVLNWMHCDSWHVAEHARSRGKGVIFMTPHLGGFEMCAFCVARHMPVTVMYRPPKMQWLEPLMLTGRARFGASVVPATMRGVRAFFRSLKEGGGVGLLPDQTPGAGEGAWAPFFGRSAYTMTLVKRLQLATGAALVMVCSERMPKGVGFHITFEEIACDSFDETTLNRAVESSVCRCPTQYLWGYNRYKAPAGAPPLPPSRPERAS